MKKIGIVGYSAGQFFGVGVSYISFIMRLGGQPVILSLNSSIQEDLNLLILPGGPDVSPERYGEMPSFETGRPDPIREYFDTKKLPYYIEAGIPILGICRGMQTIAVHFGCKLMQDMYHETNKDDDPSKGVHDLNIIHPVLSSKAKKTKVNSRHHQSVIPNDKIEVLATHSMMHDHIEAIAVKGHKIRGVQWHPEDLDDFSGMAYTRALIREIIS